VVFVLVGASAIVREATERQKTVATSAVPPMIANDLNRPRTDRKVAKSRAVLPVATAIGRTAAFLLLRSA
jgi:hypothetical protein